MYYNFKEWEDDDSFLYLGSEQNPVTHLGYDFWIYKYPESSESSVICRHGDIDYQYGSQSLDYAYPTLESLSNPAVIKRYYFKDYLFGIYRMVQIGSFFVATGRLALPCSESCQEVAKRFYDAHYSRS